MCVTAVCVTLSPLRSVSALWVAGRRFRWSSMVGWSLDRHPPSEKESGYDPGDCWDRNQLWGHLGGFWLPLKSSLSTSSLGAVFCGSTAPIALSIFLCSKAYSSQKTKKPPASSSGNICSLSLAAFRGTQDGSCPPKAPHVGVPQHFQDNF